MDPNWIEFVNTISPDIFKLMLLKLKLNTIMKVCTLLDKKISSKICDKHFYDKLAQKYKLKINTKVDTKTLVQSYTKYIYLYQKRKSDIVYQFQWFLYNRFLDEREKVTKDESNRSRFRILLEMLKSGDPGFQIDIKCIWYSLESSNFILTYNMSDHNPELGLLNKYHSKNYISEFKIDPKLKLFSEKEYKENYDDCSKTKRGLGISEVILFDSNLVEEFYWNEDDITKILTKR